ncbi:MAG: hypothetical protein HYY25_01035 [Candidatus Wallbacteria bacterium]|nr:hypothetical protein [Candidatus Wallbacteria bacterium]
MTAARWIVADEKLSWTQIKEVYPDEWVIIADAKEDWDAREGYCGRVLYHSPSRSFIHEKQKDIEEIVAVVYTGEVHGRIWLVKSEVAP